LFADPNQTVRVGNRTYELFYDGTNLSTVAWREYGAVYWVHNTLTDAVGNGELLAIAEQTNPIAGVVSPGGAAHAGKHGKTTPNLGAVPVPTLTTPAQRFTTVETIGSIGGVVALVSLPLLLLGLVHRRRQLRRLRAELRELDDRQAYLLAAAEATRESWAELAGPRPPPARPQRPQRPTPPARPTPPVPVPHVGPPAGVAAPPPTPMPPPATAAARRGVREPV
jgi:hypothetical protein